MKKPRNRTPNPTPWKCERGFIKIPLRDVLAILRYRVEYSDDSFDFHHVRTNRLLFSAPRSEQYRSPWDVLHERRVFNQSLFTRRAHDYMARRSETDTEK